MENPRKKQRVEAAATARLKRKLILQRRRTQNLIQKFRRTAKSSTTTVTTENTPVSTPLSDIINCSKQFTRPSTSQNISKCSKRLRNIDTLASNLHNRFDSANPHILSSSKPPNSFVRKNFSRDKPSKIPSLESDCSEISDHNIDDDVDDEDNCNNPTINIDRDKSQGYSDIGDPRIECLHCDAQMWYQERKQKARHCTMPTFQMCCGNGKVQVPLLKHPPHVLQHLLFDHNSEQSKNFQENIRTYNSMFAFTSPGFKFDNRFNRGRGPPIIRIQGQPCHRIGSLLPDEVEKPKFAQLYIFDTENEVQNRLHNVRNNKKIDVNIVTQLCGMLDEHNVHVQSYRMARDRLLDNNFSDIKLRLISERSTDGRIYNQPTVLEVVALIVGDVDTGQERDIILEKQGGGLKRITEFAPYYLGYQYPLSVLLNLRITEFAPYGWRQGTLHKDQKNEKITKYNRLTIMDWLSFRLQTRKMEAQTLLNSRRLFQQFLVDGFTMMESQRLTWIKQNQSTLRVGKYKKLSEDATDGPKKGKRIVLPSSFVGSRRYMDQLYFDGMAISSVVGFPDLLITFTCNPNWPEIKRFVSKRNLQPHNRPYIISIIFKIKLDELMKDLTRNRVLGKCIEYLYTVEFQKRGLPHAHILLFLHSSSKYPNPDDINRIISAEIPNPTTETELYNLVKEHMIHGPCGIGHINYPCMKNGKCTKYFPKKYEETTVVDQDGYTDEEGMDTLLLKMV